MRATMTVRRLGRGVTLAAAGLLLAPPPARAQTPIATAVLYEVNEALRFAKGRRPTTDPAEFSRRLAEASLLGKEVQTPSDDPLFRAGGFITSRAVSQVDLRTGKGPVAGNFNLLVDLDPARESLDTLMVTGSGWIRGELDLTTAAQQGFATLSGRWGSLKPKRGGALQGIFLIPFRNPLDPADEGYYYADLGLEGPGTLCGSGMFCPLRDDEFSLGIPLTKLLVAFLE